MAVNSEKEKAIELAISAVERQFGKGSIMRLGNEEPLVRDLQVISTGSLSLDIALGVGGVPRGRIVEVYGPESSGKTTLCLHIVAEAQKKGGICGYIDAEHALDVAYSRKLGVRTDDLLLSQPDTGEQALEIAEMLVRSGAIDVLVIDSVAALVPKAELEGEMGDAHMGVQARLMSQALRKLTGTISKSQTCVVFINQIRMKIGVMFGNPETTTGGNALKFYASQRMDIRRIDLASQENILEKSGAWYSFNGERIGQGRENAKDYLRDHPEIAKEVERRVLEKFGLSKIGALQSVNNLEDGSEEKRPRVKAVK